MNKYKVFYISVLLVLMTITSFADREPLRVVLSFDDAIKDHLTIAAPELEARGWRGIFNIGLLQVGGSPKKLTWEDARELVRRGHELATHSVSHSVMTKLSDEKIHGELALSRDGIAKHTGFVPRYYCPPFINQDERTARLARLEGLEQMLACRCVVGKSDGAYIRKALMDAYDKGTKRMDILHHGICATENGGSGGYRAFETKAAFTDHLNAIAELERAGKIIVTDYDGFLSDCKLKAKAWPRHGVIALSFDDHNLADWEAAFPIFAKYKATATFFICGAIGNAEIDFTRKAMLRGHEVGLHGLNHRNADSAVASMGADRYWKEEIVPQLDAFLAAGIHPRSFAYPNCRCSPETDELFKTNGFARLRGLGKGQAISNPYDPKGERMNQWRKVSENAAEFYPASDYLTLLRVRNVIMGSAYHTDIEDFSQAFKRAGERGELLSVVSHGIRAKPNGISMQTAWLERLLSEAAEAGVIVRGIR